MTMAEQLLEHVLSVQQRKLLLPLLSPVCLTLITHSCTAAAVVYAPTSAGAVNTTQ
jgi:hypothetical protein